MKYFAIFFILIISSLVSINDVHALLVSKDPVKEMDVIVIGTIVSAIPKIDALNSIAETQYDVKVYEIIKGWKLLENGNDTQTIRFTGPGILDHQFNPVYRKIFDVDDRALLMLKQKNGHLYESLWSRTTQSNCNGNEIMKLLDAPGGLYIHQNDTDNSPFYINHPVSAQYSFFNKNLTATTLNVTINVIDDFPDIYHSESFVLNLDECQAYETVETEFVIEKPSSISIHTVVDGESSHGISGLKVIDHIASPLKQFKSGIVIDEIQCRESLTFVTKHDGSPACVTPETRQNLIDRGWAKYNAMLQKVFDLCGCQESGGPCINPIFKWGNETHHIDSLNCKWSVMNAQENGIALDLTAHPGFEKNNLFEQKQLERILDHCERQELGLPVNYPYLQYENETHIITNDTCEWRKMHIHENVGEKENEK